MARTPDPARRQLWSERIERQRLSSLSVAKFCQSEQISPNSFYQWRRKLGGPPSPPTARFAEIVVDDFSAGRWATIDLPGGATVKLTGGLDQAHLQQIIAAVVTATAQAEAS